jgi:hypothetical protein
MKPRDVFINCPFSADYHDFFQAIVFAVARSGFKPRCAREKDDGGEVRFDKICAIISECQYGIHDISNTELDAVSGLPRFNMPFELGLFLGARKFNSRRYSQQKALIFDREPHRYQKFISDISGQDIHAHGADVQTLIGKICAWLRDEVGDSRVPGGNAIATEYSRFRVDLPAVAAAKHLTIDELTFRDLVAIATEWIVAEAGA